LHDRLKIIHQVEKNHGEKRVDIAKRLGLPTSTLNTILAKKNDIREQIQKCGNTCKKLKTSKESTFAELESLPSLLEGYEPRDVYNADETGLFFNVLPERTLAYKGETCHGGKDSKDRLTVLLCVDSDGSDKQVPFVIGKYLKPRCFKDGKKLPIKYHANSKAWMMMTRFFVRSSIL
jgi:hypothetical protein